MNDLVNAPGTVGCPCCADRDLTPPRVPPQSSRFIGYPGAVPIVESSVEESA